MSSRKATPSPRGETRTKLTRGILAERQRTVKPNDRGTGLSTRVEKTSGGFPSQAAL
jgi:hypothetical protein